MASLESLLRNLIKDVASWQEQLQVSVPHTHTHVTILPNIFHLLQRVLESRVTLLEGMLLYSVNTPSLTNFQIYITQLQKAVKAQVIYYITLLILTLYLCRQSL